MSLSEDYMNRCLQLAELGAGHVAPNPMVGAVLVYGNKIIGEGYHKNFGEQHAEVNCIASVEEKNKSLIPLSTLYVSLEPCTHFGKTPPCTDLIIKNRIPKVIIGCGDPFTKVNGKGIEKLKAAGIKVETGILEKRCIELNKRFFTLHTKQRPYVILKWAETADGFIAFLNPPPFDGGTSVQSRLSRLHISNEYSHRIVHKWRSEEASILVGTDTALMDDPELNTRLWSGKSPMRLIVDMNLRLPGSLKIFDKKEQTIIFNKIKNEELHNLLFYKIDESKIVFQILDSLYKLKIQSVFVEGGSRLLQSFINEDLWDEARVIVNEKLIIGDGLKAPVLTKGVATEKINSGSDTITICYR